MTAGFLQLGPALLAWAAVIFKLPAVRHSAHNPALRAFWLGLVGVALTLTVLLPPVYLTIDRLVGVPNLARPLGHGLALAAGWSVQTFLLLVNYPAAMAWGKARRRGGVLVGTLISMATLFALAPVNDETTEFMSRYADAPFMLEYWLVFLAYLAVVGENVVRLTWRYARLSDRATLRLGLRLTAVGALFGLGYVAHEGLYLAARRRGFGYPPGDKEAVTQVLLASAAGFIMVGSTMPAWGPRVGLPRLWRWIDQYWAYRQLYPLWLALCRSSPEIALIPPSPSVVDALAVRDLDFRLYRRVIEIRDGCLALRAYLNPRVADAARTLGREAGLAGKQLQAVVEATALAAALRAKERRQRAAEDGTFETSGGEDLETEVEWLVKVANCYAASPLVHAVLARPERENSERIADQVGSDQP